MPDAPEDKGKNAETESQESAHAPSRHTASPFPPLPGAASAQNDATDEHASSSQHVVVPAQDANGLAPTVTPDRWVREDSDWDTSMHAALGGRSPYDRDYPGQALRYQRTRPPSRMKSGIVLAAVIVLIVACVIGGFQLVHYGQIAIHSLQSTPTPTATHTPVATATAKKSATPHK